MKKLFIVVGCISQILFSCHKNKDPDSLTNKKPGLTNPGDNKVSIKVTDIYSKLYAIKRRIDFINQKTNEVLLKMFVTLSCNNPKDSLYKKIIYEPEKFSGQITLSSYLFRLTKRIKNGKEVKVEYLTSKELAANIDPDLKPDFEPEPDLNPIQFPNRSMGASCILSSIASCASTILNGMSWQDFADCALKANICLSNTLGYCSGKLCTNFPDWFYSD